MGIGIIKDCAPLPLGTVAQLNALGWQGRSADIFVPGQAGFFDVVGNAPETVIANFAVGKGILNQPDRLQKTESKRLATTRLKKRLEFCAAVTTSTLASANCSFDSAFIAIDGYLPGLHGELDMQYVNWLNLGKFRTAANLPNMPRSVRATWYSESGVMKFNSPFPLKTDLWKRVIGQVLYRPGGLSSDKTVTFRFGVGGLPFFEGNTYHMHDFVKPSVPLSFDNASIAAAAPSAQFCGMRSYLAAITSEAEQEHLEDVMKTSVSRVWQSGWIGGTVKQGQVFEWITPPQSTISQFWRGNGATGQRGFPMMGSPVNSRRQALYPSSNSIINRLYPVTASALSCRIATALPRRDIATQTGPVERIGTPVTAVQGSARRSVRSFVSRGSRRMARPSPFTVISDVRAPGSACPAQQPGATLTKATPPVDIIGSLTRPVCRPA